MSSRIILIIGLIRRGKGLAAASWGQIVSAAAALLGIRFYTESMSSQMFGQAMLALGGLTFIDGVLGMAFSQTLVSLLKDQETRRARMGLGLGLAVWFAALMLGLFALLTLALGMAYLFGWAAIKAVMLPLMFIAILYALEEPLRITGQALILLERRYMTMSAWQASDALVSMFASIVCLNLVPHNTLSLCIGLISGRVVTTLIFWLSLFGPFSLFSADIAHAREKRRRALEFGLPVSAMAPLGWVSLYVDRYVVGFVTGPVSAGLLAALTGAVTRPYSILSSSLTNYFRPDMLDHAAGRESSNARALQSWLIVGGCLGAIGVIGMLIVGPFLVDFLIRFRSGTEDAATLVVLIALSQVLMLLTHAVDNQVLAMGQSRRLLVGQIIAVALGLPMIAGGAFAYGLLGAAWGRILNECLKLLLAAIVLQRLRIHVRNTPISDLRSS